MKLSNIILEGTYDVEGITADNVEKVDITFVDGKTMLYGVYVYLKDGSGTNWDKKLYSKEAQRMLDILGIDIDFQSDPYEAHGAVLKALEEKGIKADTSEFDVS